MASILKNAKNLYNKISDEINKDKWDRSCINSALFTEPVLAAVPAPSSIRPSFQQQINERNSRILQAGISAKEQSAEQTPIVKVNTPKSKENTERKVCYYTHIKEADGAGRNVVYRGCDTKCIWTDRMDTKEAIQDTICPVCGLPIDNIYTEMD